MRINQENKSVDMEVRDINYILPAYVRSYLFYCKNEMPEKIIFPLFPSVKVGDKDIPIEYVPPLDSIAVEIAQDASNIPEVTPEQEAAIDEKDEEIKRLRAELSKHTDEPELEPISDEEVTEGLTEEEQVYEAAKADQPEPPAVSPAKAAFAEPTSEPIPARPDIEGTPEQQVSEAEEIGIGEPELEPTPERIGEQLAEESRITKPKPVAFTIDPNPAHQPPPDRKPIQPPGGDIGPGVGLSDMHGRDRRDQIRTAKDLVEEPDISEAEEKDYEKDVSRDEQGRPVVEEKKEEG